LDVKVLSQDSKKLINVCNILIKLSPNLVKV
jgi:hypothetical protein